MQSFNVRDLIAQNYLKQQAVNNNNNTIKEEAKKEAPKEEKVQVNNKAVNPDDHTDEETYKKSNENLFVGGLRSNNKPKTVSPDKLISNAFNFEKEDKPVNGTSLQAQDIIDKPLYYTFNIPTESRSDSLLVGQGDYKTTRIDNFLAEYDDAGKLVSITTYDKNDANKEIGKNTYTYNGDGTFAELHNDYVTGVVIETSYNSNGSIDEHREYQSQSAFKRGDAVVERKYSYGFDENGNPVQTMKNNHDITVTTTYDVKTGKYNQVNSYIEAKKAETAKKEMTEQEKCELKALAFNFGKTDAPHNGSNLQTKFIIDKQYTWVFGIPQFAEPNHVEKGDADYQTGRLDNYKAEYDAQGVISKVITTSKEDAGKVLTEISYDRTDDDYWTETVYDRSTNTITQSYINPDGTIEWHKEFASPESMESDRPEVERNYTYSFDENGNPVQTMKNNHDITVTTTYDVKTGEYTQVNSYIEAKKAETAKETEIKPAQVASNKVEAETAKVQSSSSLKTEAPAAQTAVKADEAKQPLKEDVLSTAFNFEKEDKPVNGTSLQAQYIIDKPLYYTFNIPTESRSDSLLVGQGDYKTTRIDNFLAEYDKNGKLVSITTYDKNDPNKEIGKNTYTYNSDGTFAELHNDYVTGVVIETSYNSNGSIDEHREYQSQSAFKRGDAVVERKYSYGFDENGNPVQTMKNNHDITVTTTYDVKTGKYNQVNSYIEAKKEKAAKIANAFNFEKEDKPVNGTSLQAQDIIDKPLYYTFNIPTKNVPGKIVKGEGDYKTSRIDNYVAEYDDAGRLLSITTYDKNDPSKEIGKNSYVFKEDGTFAELHNDYVTGVVIETNYNSDGSINTHKEYQTQSQFYKGKAVVDRKYSYDVDENGNAVQTMKNNHGITVITTQDAKTGKYEQNIIR